jgi:hypothetical protein
MKTKVTKGESGGGGGVGGFRKATYSAFCFSELEGLAGDFEPINMIGHFVCVGWENCESIVVVDLLGRV